MELSLTEKFLILAMHPEKGRFNIAGMQVAYGFTGALLMELSLEERIVIEGGKVVVKNDKRVKDALLSEIMEMMASSRRERKVRYWVNKIYKR